jgi:hypothetical protein
VPPPVIESWLWEEDDLEELAAHGVSRRIVLQVASEDPKFRRNKNARAARLQMIGPDRGGHIWTIFVQQVPWRPGLWRAITGRDAEPEERVWYGKS